jgi:xanthine dehydrogenase YagT iron-sulfur-binding subunit
MSTRLDTAPGGPAAPPSPKVRITLTVNGAARGMEIAPWTTLLDALREQLDLTGTKQGVVK